MSRGPAIHDASRGRSPDRTRLRAGDRNGGAVSLRQADRELSGTGTVGGLQWGASPARTVEAAQVTVRSNQEWRSKFFHLAMRRGRKIAKVAMARRLAIRLYWMWRKEWNYEQLTKFGSHAGQPGNPHGVQ